MNTNGAAIRASVESEFVRAIGLMGGEVKETICDDSILFARSVLPDKKDVKSGDAVQGGVALRATDGEVWIHPYVFRLVCTNGAIRAHAVQSRHIRILEESLKDSLGEVRSAVVACGAEDAFAHGVDEMRSSADERVDMLIDIMRLYEAMRSHVANPAFESLMIGLMRNPEQSRFDLMNSITAAAREVGDPKVKWDLEVIGAAVGSRRPARSQSDIVAFARVPAGA